LDRRRVVLAAVALAAGLLVAWVMLTNHVRPATATDVFVVLAIGWSFVASGLVAWQLRPENAIGPDHVTDRGADPRTETTREENRALTPASRTNVTWYPRGKPHQTALEAVGDWWLYAGRSVRSWQNVSRNRLRVLGFDVC
jgi:hypothetical protein